MAGNVSRGSICCGFHPWESICRGTFKGTVTAMYARALVCGHRHKIVLCSDTGTPSIWATFGVRVESWVQMFRCMGTMLEFWCEYLGKGDIVHINAQGESYSGNKCELLGLYFKLYPICFLDNKWVMAGVCCGCISQNCVQGKCWIVLRYCYREWHLEICTRSRLFHGMLHVPVCFECHWYALRTMGKSGSLVVLKATSQPAMHVYVNGFNIMLLLFFWPIEFL